VLEGVFSDEHGDWPPARFSQSGRLSPCTFFGARLHPVRQAEAIPGPRTEPRRRRHSQACLGAESDSGVACKALYRQAGFSDLVRLERWQPRQTWASSPMSKVQSCLSWRASLSTKPGRLRGCWLRLPAGSEHHPRSAGGCTLYIKSLVYPISGRPR